MRYPIILIFHAGILVYAQSNSYTVKDLKCQVCTRVIEEMRKNISQVDSKKTIGVGGFRLDNNGHYSQKYVLYSKSEIFLTELMENICNKMDDYVRAIVKESGKLVVISLVSADGSVNPIMSEVDVVQDSDLNKSLKYYCQDIIHELDDEFVNEFTKEEENAVLNICARATEWCDEESIIEIRKPIDEL